MTEPTITTGIPTAQDVADALAAAQSAETTVRAANESAMKHYGRVRDAYAVVATTTVDFVDSGAKNAARAISTAVKNSGGSLSPSLVAKYEIAGRIMRKDNLPATAQIAPIPTEWLSKGKKYKGYVPAYDGAGNLVRDDEGAVVTVTVVSLYSLVKSAISKENAALVRDIVKNAADAPGAIEALEALLVTTPADKDVATYLKAALTQMKKANDASLDLGDAADTWTALMVEVKAVAAARGLTV